MAAFAPPPASAARSSAEVRRLRILQVAKSHFERFGFRRTRMEDIARDAGIAKGAVYLEFESKEALLAGVFEHVSIEIRRQWEAEVVSVDSPRERLRALLRFAYAELSRNPFFERLVGEDPELGLIRALAQAGDNPRKVDAQLEQLRDWLREGIQRGEFRADLDLEAVPFVLSSLRYLHFHTDNATAGRLSRERLLEAVIDTFLAGISTPAPTPSSASRRPGRGSKR